MSSSASRGGGERMIHQDYIARIRYSNNLPPPPNPPKLLDIPNTGLASGQYTTPAFASRLAREQPLNIEADAELGMPLDLVGMPGVFDGDESSIQAPLHAPAPHLHDRALLRPLSSLGKPKFSDSGVSFLRRTEYISAYTSKSRFESSTSRSLIPKGNSQKSRRPPVSFDKESPEAIQQQIEKGFQMAALTLKDRSRVRHPSKHSAKLIDSYPLLPDLDAFPDVGGYVTVKFLTNPVGVSSVYDKRLESGILRPINLTAEEERERQEAQEAHELDPENNAAPDMKLNFEFFLPETPEAATNFRRKFDVFDADRDADALYTTTTSDGGRAFRFKRVRAYETASIVGAQGTKYDEEIVVALHDGGDGVRQRAAHYYPTIQRTTVRPQRSKNIARVRQRYAAPPPPGQEQDEQQEEDVVDFIDVVVREPNEGELKQREVFKKNPMGPQDEGGEEEEEEEEEEQQAAAQDVHEDERSAKEGLGGRQDGGARAGSNGNGSRAGTGSKSPSVMDDDELDAGHESE